MSKFIPRASVLREMRKHVLRKAKAIVELSKASKIGPDIQVQTTNPLSIKEGV